MKLRKFSIAVLVVGLLMLTVYFVDRFRNPGSYMTILLSLGASMCISGMFCLIFTKTVKQHCNIWTSVISLALSMFSGSGFLSVFMLPLIGWGGIDPIKNDIQQWVLTVSGIISLVSIIALLVVYIMVRKKKKSFLGVVLDILTAMMYLNTFILSFIYVYDEVVELIYYGLTV